MCGRYGRKSDKQRIAEAFSVSAGLADLFLEPDDDIAPGSIQPVVLTNKDGERQLELMRWGFKLPDRLLFNARSEAIDTAKFWKESFLRRRCIVPADSFYEWQKNRTGKKPKYEFEVSHRKPFGMAGVWAPWKNPKTGQLENTFAITTVEANDEMRAVHDRQPAILNPAEYSEYLSESERPPIHLLRTLSDDEMEAKLTVPEASTETQASLFDSQ
jgi:putative SOS response-associated peptidase YedK